jgi:hypothetical protein
MSKAVAHHITKRAALQALIGAAAAAAPVSALAAPNLDDAHLLRLEVQMADLIAGRSGSFGADFSRLDGAILTTPCSTLSGAAVKLRYMLHESIGMGAGEISDQRSEIALRQVLAVISRRL